MVMYTSEGWINVKFPAFVDLEEMCRQTDELDAQEWQKSKNEIAEREYNDE